MSGKTSTRVKEKYNEKTYARYSFRVRKDSQLYHEIEEFKKTGGSLNALIEDSLKDKFAQELPF